MGSARSPPRARAPHQPSGRTIPARPPPPSEGGSVLPLAPDPIALVRARGVNPQPVRKTTIPPMRARHEATTPSDGGIPASPQRASYSALAGTARFVPNGSSVRGDPLGFEPRGLHSPCSLLVAADGTPPLGVAFVVLGDLAHLVQQRRVVHDPMPCELRVLRVQLAADERPAVT